MNTVAPQVIFQLYRGGIPGPRQAARAKLQQGVATLSQAGSDLVCFHGFPRELQAAWEGLAKLAKDEGVAAMASWGLDGEADNDRTVLTGAEKGACMGAVLAQGSCVAGLADAEGRYDDAEKRRPGDPTDEDDVLAMGEALRALAPDALVGDQCWFAIQSHGDLRGKASKILAADPRNVFAGFPVDEFARKVVNWRQFRQGYCNQAGFVARWGRNRYEKIFEWMAKDWATLEAPFKQAGLHYAPGVTIQGYGWDDVPADLAHCMLDTVVTKQQPLIVWCHWMPSHLVLQMSRVVRFLVERGFALPGLPAAEIVKRFQIDYNLTARVKLKVDGQLGMNTALAAGFKITL